MILRALFLVCAASVPSFCAEVWTLPLFTSDPAQAYDAAQKFTPPKNTDVYLIDVDVTLTIDSAGHLSNKRLMVARILTDAGVRELPNIIEPWMAWRQNKPVLRARVITADKQPHVLDPTTVTEAGLPGVNDMYGDVKILQAPLPALSSGSVVEYEVETVDREAVMPGARFDDYPVSWPFPIHHLKVLVQTRSPIHAEARGFDAIERSETTPGTLRFEAWDMRKHENEQLLPPDAPSGPEILVTTANSWQSVARWYFDLTEPLLAKAAAQSVAVADRDATIRSILADIQKNVRYTGLELGMGAYAPRTPAETLTRGYGDCKDKATLLISRLRAAGITAQYALLRPFPFQDVVPDMPGMEAFNHVIVYLPGPHPQWIDPTSEFTPATRLPISDQGRAALIVDRETTTLTRTPESAPGDNRVEVENTITLQPEGKAKLLVRNRFTGGVEDIVRNSFSVLLNSPGQKAKLESALQQQLRVEKITSIDSDPPLAFEKPYELRVAGEGLASSETKGERATAFVPFDQEILGGLVQLASAEKAEKKTESNTDEEESQPARKQDYYLLEKFTAEARTIVVPPPGFRVKQVPEVHDITIAGSTVERTASLRPDNAVVIIDRYTVPKLRFSVAEAEKTAEELKDLNKLSALRVEFVDQAQQLLTEGKDKDSLRLARERVSDAPKDPAALVHLAATLSSLGANLEAINVCLRATAIDPESEQAYEELADLYARDEAGRPHGPGMQRRKAIEAIQRAIVLKPKETLLSVKLAELYSYNDKGILLGKGDDLPDAVSTLRKVEADLDGVNANLALPSMLFVNRQFDDLKALYAKDRNRAPISYRVAAIAVSGSVEEAVTAFDASGSPEGRQTALEDAAKHLLLIHEYPAAGGLLREASREDGNAQADAEMLAQTRPRSQAKYSDKPPIAVTQHLIYALLDFDEPDEWKQLFVPEWRDLKLRVERNRIGHSLSAYHQIAKISMGWEGTADLAVSNGAFVSEGSDETGYRVRMADPSNNGAMKTLAWVVKRGDAYLVLGLDNDWAALGTEALAATQRKDLKAAEQWLDWMREEAPHESATDPLGGIAFTRLWKPGATGLQEATAAAASLALRGAHYEKALAALRDLQKQTPSGAFRDGLDLAVVEGLGRHERAGESVTEAKSLMEHFPNSDFALMNLAVAMSAAGQDAQHLLTERLATDPNSAAALRAEAKIRETKRDYAGAVDALRKLAQSPKVTADDWNNLAWASLFLPDTAAPALDAANTANRLTQNRNASMQHTLGCVRAVAGDTSGARKALLKYLDSAGEIDDSAHLLLGMIQEQLSLADAARLSYLKLEKPEMDEPLSSYALAQKHLAGMAGVKQISAK